MRHNLDDCIEPEPNSGCWIWVGKRDRHGYGQSKRGGRTRGAHRMMWEALRGVIPAGLQIDHLCRVKACVNPAHLEVVTASVNQRRRYAALGNSARQTALAVRGVWEATGAPRRLRGRRGWGRADRPDGAA